MAIPYYRQYCYGFNRCQFWLLAQGLIQSVHSLQVSDNAILQYCYGFNRRQLWLSLLAQGLLQSVPSLQVSAWGNAILQYCNGFKVLSAEFYFHKPITVHLELYLFYCFIHFLLYIGQY